MDLPKEAIYRVLLNLPLEQVNRNCSLNKRYNTVCQSKAFWQEYGNKNYWLKLTNDIDLLEMKRLIKKADKILKYIEKNKSLLKYDSYLYMVFAIEDEDLEKIFANNRLGKIVSLPKQLYLSNLQDKYNYTWSQGPELEPGNNFISVGGDEDMLNSRGERNYNMIWKNVIKPTLYTNGKELIVIDYDIDFGLTKYANDPFLFDMVISDERNKYDDIVEKYLS